MLTNTDLDAPAQLQYWTVDQDLAGDLASWSEAFTYPSLREALQAAMEADAPAGNGPFILTDSGLVLGPQMLEGLWSSLLRA